MLVSTIAGWGPPEPAGKGIAESLHRHGVNVLMREVANGPAGHGAIILHTATNVGADLLVKGAYTQSRLRQMIFGGATSHILSSATLPLFMAH